MQVKDEGMLQDAPLGQTYYDVSTLPPDQPVEAVLFLMRDEEDGKHMYNKDAGLGTLTIRVHHPVCALYKGGRRLVYSDFSPAFLEPSS